MGASARARVIRRVVALVVAIAVLTGVPSLTAVAADPTGTISGTVYLDRGDGTRAPLSSASVSVYSYPSGAFVWSFDVDARGKYTVSLSSGQYTLMASTLNADLQPFLPPEWSGGTRSQATATPVTVVAGHDAVTDMVIDLGGQVEMWPSVVPAPGAAPVRPVPMFTHYTFTRVDPSTGQVLATYYPTFQSEFDTGEDVSTPLEAGTYDVAITASWYNSGDPFQATQRIFFTGSVTGIVVRPGERTHVGEVRLRTDYYDQIPIYRFWSPVYRGHFFTADAAEKDSVIANLSSVWNYEGIAFWAFATQRAGTVPLYRFWSGQFHGHFYTADLTERDHVIATYPGTWYYEDVAFYVYPPSAPGMDTTSVTRFWGPTVRHHFYTASGPEAETIRRTLASLWSDDGLAFWVPSRG